MLCEVAGSAVTGMNDGSFLFTRGHRSLTGPLGHRGQAQEDTSELSPRASPPPHEDHPGFGAPVSPLDCPLHCKTDQQSD